MFLQLYWLIVHDGKTVISYFMPKHQMLKFSYNFKAKINRNPSILGRLSVIKWRNWTWWESYLNTGISDETQIAVVVWLQCKEPIRNAADGIFCNIFPFSERIRYASWQFSWNIMPYLFFLKSGKIWNSRLVQIIGGAYGLSSYLVSVPTQGSYRHVWVKFKDFSRTSKDYPRVFKD